MVIGSKNLKDPLVEPLDDRDSGSRSRLSLVRTPRLPRSFIRPSNAKHGKPGSAPGFESLWYSLIELNGRQWRLIYGFKPSHLCHFLRKAGYQFDTSDTRHNGFGSNTIRVIVSQT